jgi:outer membrane protein assembly factor BamB
VPGQNADRTSHNPFERTITSDNVSDLHEVWRWDAPVPNVFGPVTSSGGVHVVVPCAIVTLDPATGVERWGQAIIDPSQCAVVDWHATDPYVVTDGDRVIASAGLTLVRPPGFLEASWETKVFDAATGAPDGSAPVGFIGAQRGRRLAGLVQTAVGQFAAGTTLQIGDLDGAQSRSFTTAVFPAVTGTGGPTATLTLGADLVFHSGAGIMATTPGSGTQGQAVRAFSLTDSRPGCGPVSSPPGSYSVECPLWVTPTDGTPTAAVLSSDGATAYVRTGAGTLYALDAATGATRWTASGLGSAGAPALAGATLYVPTGDGRIVTFDAAGCGGPTCTPTGEFATGATGAVSTPAVAGDLVYATAGGSVFAFAAGGCGGPCDPQWSAPGSGAPVVSRGQVYVRSAAGVVAYGLT